MLLYVVSESWLTCRGSPLEFQRLSRIAIVEPSLQGVVACSTKP